MNILLSGICGHMGNEVAKLCSESYRSSKLVAGVDLYAGAYGSTPIYAGFSSVPYDIDVHCIVDFSHHDSTPRLLSFARERRLPLVIATTGHTEEQLEEIKHAAKDIPIFFSANMSLGVALLVELAKNAALAMPDAEIEIIEKHHDRKIDAPSGTALMLAKAITEVRPEAYPNPGRSGQGKRTKDEIGIHAIRMGNVVGEHEVILATQNQTISIKHEAHSRALFAEGALAAAAFIKEAGPGLYDMNSLIKNSAKAAVAAV